MDSNRQKTWSGILIFILSATIAYLAMEWLTRPSIPVPQDTGNVFFEPPPAMEEDDLTASILTPEEALSPAELAARQDLADLPFVPGSVGDKLFNLLSSEKTDYSRELYTFLHDFAPESSQLPDDLKKELDQLATVLRAYPELAVQLDVHTAAQGDLSAMRALSREQAAALKAHLVAAGLPAASVDVAGMGADAPLTTNTDEASRAQNRRIELSLRTQ